MDQVRVTVAVATVLGVFLDDIERHQYGYDLMRTTGFPSGKLYPILARLQAAGWLRSEFEEMDAAKAKRPPRRWYQLTGEGELAAREALAALRRQLESPVVRWRFAPGGRSA